MGSQPGGIERPGVELPDVTVYAAPDIITPDIKCKLRVKYVLRRTPQSKPVWKESAFSPRSRERKH